MTRKIEAITIEELIDALCDENNVLPPRYLYRFSDMMDSEIEKLGEAWAKIPDWRRRALMEDLEDLGERDDLLSFESVARLALRDSQAVTRLSAVRTLWEYDGRDIGNLFVDLLRHDPDIEVRAAAASGLGKFVYAGEVGELPAAFLDKIVNLLMEVVESDGNNLVRRRALESLGYAERSEIPVMIRKAFENGEKEWAASALAAMGHSADRSWAASITDSLDSTHPIVRSEAARAAGELALKKAVPKLLEMLDDPDNNARDSAIWALSQTGGTGVRSSLERLLSKPDDAEAEYIEAALEMLAFTEETTFFPLIDIDELEEDPSDEF
jgi:HEAT repeat protein